MDENERRHLLSSSIISNDRRHLLASSRRSKTSYFDDDDDNNNDEIHETGKVPVWCSYRFGIIVCCTMSMTISFAAQASMSSAFVCMLDEGNNEDVANNEGNMTALNVTFNFINLTLANGTVRNEWIFDWDKTTQGFVLSSFFMGYYVSQIPSSFASARYGAKKVVVFGLVFTSLFQILAVPAAYFGVGWLYADRIITGILSGFLYAPTFALVGQWTPRPETSLLFGLVGIGMELGNVVSFLISLFSCEIDIQGGWPFVFYTLGAVGLIVALFFVVFVSDSPFDNRLMSQKEVDFIVAHVPKMEEKSNKAMTRIPVKEIVKSTPVWAIVVSQLGGDWLYYFVVTVAPTFLKDVIKLSNAEVNLLSGLPFLGIVPSIYFAGHMCDRLVTRGIISNTNIRKINDGVCKLIPAAILVGLGFLPTGATAAGFVLNTINAMALGFSYVSWMANPVDLAPAFTGFIAAFCELGAVWVAIVVPILVELITADKSREQWQLAFYITAGLQVVCYIFYLIFASGELQPWALSTYKHTRKTTDDIDGKDTKKKLFLDRGSKNILRVSNKSELSSSSTDSVGKAKMEAKEEDTDLLITSLTMSLGGFRGTSSYEAEAERQRDRNKETNGVDGNGSMIGGNHGYTNAILMPVDKENDVGVSGYDYGDMNSRSNTGVVEAERQRERNKETDAVVGNGSVIGRNHGYTDAILMHVDKENDVDVSGQDYGDMNSRSNTGVTENVSAHTNAGFVTNEAGISAGTSEKDLCVPSTIQEGIVEKKEAGDREIPPITIHLDNAGQATAHLLTTNSPPMSHIL